MRILLHLLMAWAFSQSLAAQMAIPASMGSIDNASKNWSAEVYSFELDGGLIMVNGRAGDKSGKYILDTGAPTLILNSNVYSSDQKSEWAFGLSGSARLQSLRVKDFEVANIQQEKIKAYTTDISHIEKVKNRPIEGLLGYEAIKSKEIMIDYEKQQIAFMDVTDPYGQMMDKEVVDQLPFRYRDHLPIVKVRIGKRTYYFGIDTGAEANIINVRLKKRMRKFSDKEYNSRLLQGVDPSQAEALSTTLKEIKIKGHSFEDLEFVFANIYYINRNHDILLDGILGAPFLKSRTFSINFKDKKLKIWEDIPSIDPHLPAPQKEALAKSTQQE
ncbi:MAG: aspartyl protease family protein [Bacteroidota bacterium]